MAQVRTRCCFCSPPTRLLSTSWWRKCIKIKRRYSVCMIGTSCCKVAIACVVDGNRWHRGVVMVAPRYRHHYYYFRWLQFAIFLLVVAWILNWWRQRRMVRKLALRKRPRVTDIGPAIANFYDSRSHLWETLWGEHMHHGYYGETGREKKDRIRAQEDMIEELWKFAELDAVLATNQAVYILDVGCGIGGAARYLAKKDERIHVVGVTLSNFQVERGNVLTREQNLQDRVQLVVADAHHLPFSDNSFDIVWSLESGEHMADKYLFLSESSRVLKPHGKCAMLVWCHRKCPPPLSDEERVILYSIYEAYRLPYLCSLEELANIAVKVGMTGLKEADWSASAVPFWIQVLQTAFSFKALAELKKTDWDTVRSVFAIRHMLQALQRKLLVLGALSATKKLQSSPTMQNNNNK
ncbi:hypothetical protein GAYE_PCTG14G0546 [Galdieria yellowstonensis]|uniref:Methyltransferase type 11 domain-containing protein n=1 Tax=Galdieria yellowstonensis TaxID=3028027 RepID=A0AAV9I329_9RHOD|nr:hypothetical protein GAYE_PCTG14G0546 [Galdieria yellowstonensis]